MIRTFWKKDAAGAVFEDDDDDDDDDNNGHDDDDDDWNLLEEGCCGSWRLSLKQDVDRAWNRVA